MPRVPFELSDYIIDFLYEEPTALRACALTCRSWAPAARFHLFRSVILQNRDFTTPFQRLLHTAPDLGWYVRELTVAKFVDGDSKPPSSVAVVPQESAAVAKAIPKIFANTPALRTLSLSHVDMKCISMSDLRGLKHPSVSALSLSYCQFAEFADLVDLVACFPNVAELAISGLTWRNEIRVCTPNPIPTLQRITLGRDTDSEVLFAWFEAASFHTTVKMLTARCASQRDTDLLGPFVKLSGESLQHLDLDWSMTGDKTVVLPESISLGNCAALEHLALHFLVHYSTSVPWVTSLLATLQAASIRSISCDVRLLGNVDALDWEGLSKLLSSEAYRTVEEVNFAVNLWAGVHKDFAEVEGLIRARLAAFDKKGMLHITKA
ncbi:hypothetical protein C8Q80DRAFT_1090923 [Daedaleopsis nitida]|nr:hypothetical protein C8Q80DRAFT_1090923 [Daedaleopsis nitida]